MLPAFVAPSAAGAIRIAGMNAPERPVGDRDGAMVHLGKEIARALVDLQAGDPDEPSGWRGALQRAADLSRHDAGVLTVADEIHQAAGDLTTTAAVRAYAMSTMVVVHDGPGFWLLTGMLEGAARSPDR
jgi:hypothetical protein